MPLWLIILGTALVGGLLILNGFGQAKEVRERMLDCYAEMLDQARRHDEEDHDGGEENEDR